MHTKYTAAIAEVDKSLSLLRESWMGATGPKKAQWMEMINQSLDERSRLMALRDAAQAA